MAVTARWYAEGIRRFMMGDLNWDPSGGSSVKLALMTTTHTPAVDTDTLFSGLSNEHGETGNYTAGGAAMTLFQADVVQDTEVTGWTVATEQHVGDLIRPSSATGNIYRCIASTGDFLTHATTEPVWTGANTVGADIDDDVLTWENVGTSYINLDAVDVQWTSSTFAAGYAVIYETASSYLIGIVDFGGEETSSNGDFDVNWDTNGALQAFVSL